MNSREWREAGIRISSVDIDDLVYLETRIYEICPPQTIMGDNKYRFMMKFPPPHRRAGEIIPKFAPMTIGHVRVFWDRFYDLLYYSSVPVVFGIEKMDGFRLSAYFSGLPVNSLTMLAKWALGEGAFYLRKERGK